MSMHVDADAERSPLIQPLCSSEKEALALDGVLVRSHTGGIYRVLGKGRFNPPFVEGHPTRRCTAMFCESGTPESAEPVGLYRCGNTDPPTFLAIPEIFRRPAGQMPVDIVVAEHVWPGEHRLWAVPEELFEALTDDGRIRFISVHDHVVYGDIQ